MIRTATFAALAFLVLAGTAQAQATPQSAPESASQGAGSWSFSFGAATDNRSKDASKSRGDAYAWGAAEWESASGLFYAGPGFETVKSSTGSELELEAGAGMRPEIAGFDLDLNATYKYQIDADPGADNTAWELTADIKRSIGPASARVRLQHSPDGMGSTEAWTWVALRGGWDFSDKLTGTAEIGRREQDASIDYTGWNAGFTYALTRNIEAEVRYYDTDADPANPQYADAVVAGLSFSF
ncbi:TorF family putative porin [Brevundimonas sp.]|uniref:TorF family putative porin n=1 Tax=Brevundimonas sp. TaxID=1871086 RepID=UPI0025C4A9C1|nr:TorF family putative porin [Brevundimonas sp.]